MFWNQFGDFIDLDPNNFMNPEFIKFCGSNESVFTSLMYYNTLPFTPDSGAWGSGYKEFHQYSQPDPKV